MKIGFIGLGKMGFNLVLQMKDQNIPVIAYNRSKEKLEEVQGYGIETAYSVKELAYKMEEQDRKIFWLMVTAGDIVDELIAQILEFASDGDIIIDGGNSNYKDTLRRYELLKSKKINFVDVGTSGGIKGAREGACMMVGMEPQVKSILEPIFKSLCVKNGYAHVGYPATGHYVKMIHNGIEYGMMQAIGEGFEIMKHSNFDFDFEKIASVWNHGSIIRGYLMEKTQEAFSESPKLEEILDKIDSSGEGLWTVQEALEVGAYAPIITQSLLTRYRSKQEESFSSKVIAAQRNKFGGHAIHKKEK